MADRVVRDEILTSERYWSVSIEAQRLFMHLILNVDDTGRFSGLNYTIRAACFPGQSVDANKLEKLIEELHNTDLIRIYSVGGQRFLFVPRFRQRLRYPHSKYPAPPKEINDIPEEKTDLSQTRAGPKPDSGPTQVRPKSAEVKRSEVKRIFPPTPATSAGASADKSASKPKNPRSSRALGTNPRALGTNPRAVEGGARGAPPPVEIETDERPVACKAVIDAQIEQMRQILTANKRRPTAAEAADADTAVPEVRG